MKKKIGVGGTYKNEFIEVHGENYEQVAKFLESKKISFKKSVDKTDNLLSVCAIVRQATSKQKQN